MYSIKEQIAIIIYFLIFGIFTISFYTIISFFLNKTKIKKIFLYIIEFGFWCLLTYLASMYLLSSTKGYLPLYGICFFIVGIVIYMYLLDKRLKNDLERLYKLFSFLYKKTRKIWSIILIPKEIIDLLKKIKKKKKKGERQDEEIDSINIDIT